MSEHPISRRRFEQGVLVFDYGESKIRCGGTIDKPWFVAKDVCEVLGIANHTDTLGRLDADEKDEVGITDPIGRKQKTAVVYESGLYAIIFTSRKEEAKAFRKWVTSEVLPSIRKTGVYRAKQRLRYEQKGLSQEWIEKREGGVVIRKSFTDTLQGHGINEGWDYARATNAIYYPTLGGPAATVKRRLGLPKSANLRDNLPLLEIFVVGLAEHLAQDKIEKESRQGCEAVVQACSIAANNIANAVKRTQSERTLPPA